MADINLNFGTDDLDKIIKKLEDLRKLVNEIKGIMDKTGQVTQDQDAVLKRAQVEAMKLNAQKKRLEQAEAKINEKLKEQKGILGSLKAEEAALKKLRLQTSDAKKLNEYNKRLIEIRSTTNKLTGSTNNWGKALDSFQFKFNALGNIANTVVSSISRGFKKFISDSLQAGIEIEGIRIAFERLNKPEILNDLRKAVNNTLSDLQLMQLAVKANNFKVPLDQIATYLKFVDMRADQTGESLEQLSETFFESVGKQMPRGLAAVGISTERFNKKLKETGNYTKALNDIIQEEFERSGDEINLAGDALDQFRSTIANLKAEAGTFFWKNILDTEELSNFFNVMNDDNVSRWTKFVMAFTDFSGRQAKTILEDQRKSAEAWLYFNNKVNESSLPINEINEFTESFTEFKSLLDSINDSDLGWAEGFKKSGEDAYKVAEAFNERMLKSQKDFKELYDQVIFDKMDTDREYYDYVLDRMKDLKEKAWEDMFERQKINEQYKEYILKLKQDELGAYADFFSGLQALAGQNTIVFKLAAIAEATINMWKAAMSAIAEEKGGAKKKLAAYAIILATGLKTLASLKSVKVKQYAEGGEIGGKPHSQGGTMIEAERGEFVVKRSAYQRNKQLINALNADDSAKIALAMRADRRVEQPKEDYTKKMYELLSKQENYGELNDSYIIQKGNVKWVIPKKK